MLSTVQVLASEITPACLAVSMALGPTMLKVESWSACCWRSWMASSWVMVFSW